MLHIVAPADVGGLESVVRSLAAGHLRRGLRVAVASVVTPDRAEPALLDALREAGVPVHVLSLPGRRYLREQSVIRDLCRDWRPDVVHTHGYRPDVVDARVARGRGVPVVTTVHGFTGGSWRNRVYERLQMRAFRRFDAVVAVSRPLAERLRRAGVPGERVHLISNAWAGQAAPHGRADARALLGVPAHGHVIGWVGRFTREKGWDLLVRALAYLADPAAAAVMVGGGPELESARAASVQLGLADRIVWPGVVPDAARLFAAFDVFVLSSRTEGTPIVLFEAMSAGVPIVATAVGGVPDVVTQAEALLVPPEDPEALAAAIRITFEDHPAAARRAAAARRRLADLFGLEPWLSAYEVVYRKVARGGAKSA